MRHHGWAVGLVGLVCLVGCAGAKQAIDDTRVGLSQPINAQGESAKEVAHRDAEPLKSFPYGHIAYPAAAGLLTVLYGWQNGRRIRKQLPMAANPYTGWLGKSMPLVEGTIQTLSTILQGALSPPGTTTPFRDRLWKVGVATLVTGATAYVTSPDFQAFLADNPKLISVLGMALTVLVASEKKLQEVLPNQPAPKPNDPTVY